MGYQVVEPPPYQTKCRASFVKVLINEDTRGYDRYKHHWVASQTALLKQTALQVSQNIYDMSQEAILQDVHKGIGIQTTLVNGLGATQ